MRIKDNGQGVCFFAPVKVQPIKVQRVNVRIKRRREISTPDIVGLESEVCKTVGRPVCWIGAYAFEWGWV